jgi:PAS domain S-box-containing protein
MDYGDNWKTIIETAHDGILIVDTKGVIMAVNKATEQLTGYTAEELVGNPCTILNCTGCKIFKGESGKKWCGLFHKGKMKGKKCMITGKDRRAIHILKSASVMRDQNGKEMGAVEILTDMTEQVQQKNKIELLQRSLKSDEGYHNLLGSSPLMQRMFEMIESVAQSDAPVTIQGKSGTGKELVAMAIHEASARRDKSFIKVNCASLNENVLESELFGHVKGAYTGADSDRVGRFEAAHGGSIFLDEIGDIPLSTQVKLLRVLEDHVIEKVGDNKPISIDVRIITATNKDLEELISKGVFREDLFFRINVFPIYCPALSERWEDIPQLAQSFIKYGTRKSGKKIVGFTPEAMEKLTNYSWPGNVRELRNAVEYALVLCHGGLISPGHLPPRITKYKEEDDSAVGLSSHINQEKEQLIKALRQSSGNQTQAAKALGISRVTIWKRIKKHNLNLTKTLG